MTKPLSDEEKRLLVGAPRIWVSYPDGRKFRVIDPAYIRKIRAEASSPLPAAEDPVDPPTVLTPVYVPRTTMKAIARSVSKATGVSLPDILSGSYTARIVRARSAIYYLCYTKLGCSYPEIGKRFDKDHSGVMRGVHKHIARRKALGRRVTDATS